jgi:hypothetical protein
MLSSVKVDEVKPIFCGDGVLLQLLINNLPPFNEVSTGTKCGILLVGVDTSNEKELEVVVRATFAEEGCKRIDNGLIDTIEESWSVEQDRSPVFTAFLYNRWLSEHSGDPVSPVCKLIEKQLLRKCRHSQVQAQL